MENNQSKIIQIMSADGWAAAYREPHCDCISYLYMPLVCWALVQELSNSIPRLFDRFKPDIIGVSWITPELSEIFTELKSKNPTLLICHGIGSPQLNGKCILEGYPVIDFLSYGEGELTWANLLRCLEIGGKLEDLKGLMFRKEGQIVINEPEEPIDINALPFLEIILPKQDKLDYVKVTTIMETSRGCTNNCSFCAIRHSQQKYRAK